MGLNRLGLSTDLTQFDPFEYIARSGGKAGADTSDIFAEVTPDRDGIYHYYFGIGAIKDLDISEYIYCLEIGTELTIEDGLIYHHNVLLGQSPGYIINLSKSHPQAVCLIVAKINHDVYKFGKYSAMLKWTAKFTFLLLMMIISHCLIILFPVKPSLDSLHKSYRTHLRSFKAKSAQRAKFVCLATMLVNYSVV